MTPEEYKRLRQVVGTQQQAAELLGVSRTTIARREAPSGTIDREAAMAIQELARKSRPASGATK